MSKESEQRQADWDILVGKTIKSINPDVGNMVTILFEDDTCIGIDVEGSEYYQSDNDFPNCRPHLVKDIFE